MFIEGANEVLNENIEDDRYRETVQAMHRSWLKGENITIQDLLAQKYMLSSQAVNLGEFTKNELLEIIDSNTYIKVDTQDHAIALIK